MAFLDDDDNIFGEPEPSPERRPRPESKGRRERAPKQRRPRKQREGGGGGGRQLLGRRLLAVVVGILIVILLGLGVRGCLDARETRGMENYARDLSDTLVQQSNQLSQSFFNRLQDPQGLNPTTFAQQIAADRNTAARHAERAAELSTPGDLEPYRDELVKAFEFRAEALEGIAENTDAALGREDRQEAVEAITGYMRLLLTSDVLYQRARSGMNSVLAQREADAKLQRSVFLPEPVGQWIDDVNLTVVLANAAGGTNIAPGVHGVALGQVAINGTVLSAETSNAVEGGEYEILAQVLNQGESSETDVIVSYEITGGASDSGQTRVNRIEPGETKNARITIGNAPQDSTVTLTITVYPVPGEQVVDNNSASFSVTFGR